MTAPSVTNTQITPKTVTAPSPQVTTSNTSTTSMPMDHSMMGHSM
jgi:hypothetical protein